MEQFSIPGVGGIIVKEHEGEKYILLQTRIKPHALYEDGLLEIPAGKIRAFENIFEALKREIKEETGLEVVEILGESISTVYKGNNYKVVNFMPFSCAQNIQGEYPIMVFVFICHVLVIYCRHQTKRRILDGLRFQKYPLCSIKNQEFSIQCT